jgi:hypothetical protein
MIAHSFSQRYELMVFAVTIADDDASAVIIVGLECAMLTITRLFLRSPFIHTLRYQLLKFSNNNSFRFK